MHWSKLRVNKIGDAKGNHEVEETLMKSGVFNLPSKKVLQTLNSRIEIIMVDSTEILIERQKNRQKRYYSGKKTAHNKSADS